MNHCVPGWTTEDHTRPSDLMPMASQISMAPENELIELLWQNGHVVMHNQTHRRSAAAAAESKHAQKPDPLLKVASSLGNPSDLTLEDETACWLHYALDDSLDKEFCSEFFCEMPAIDADKLSKDVITEGEIYSKFGSTVESNVLTGSASKSTNLCQEEATMPPPKSHPRGFNQQATNFENGGDTDFSYFSRPVESNLGLLSAQSAPKRAGNWVKVKMGESSSMMTIGSSACGSNQILKQFDDNYALSNEATTSQAKGLKEDVLTRPRHDGVQRNNYETAVASSSGGSGCSFGRAEQQSGSTRRQKRKGRDGEDSECHSEDAECESAEAKKRAQGSATARRSRAAEVHNLSERRRRDRINEKMKALQDLIPHCNKSDKASMLDEAIEYLKSLQLQVQIMWMGSGMAPMMFPSVQQYMSRMGMGMAHASMPSMHSPIQLPKVPLAGQSVPSAPTAYHTPICPSPALNQVNFPSQMPNVQFPDSYAHYLGFPHMQPPRQAMNLYSFGSEMMQHNQPAAGAISSGMHVAGTVPSEKNQNGQSG